MSHLLLYSANNNSQPNNLFKKYFSLHRLRSSGSFTTLLKKHTIHHSRLGAAAQQSRTFFFLSLLCRLRKESTHSYQYGLRENW